MLNIISHQKYASQSHSDILPHCGKNDFYQIEKRKQVLLRMWRKENSCLLLKEYKLVERAIMENSMGISQKMKNRATTRPNIPFCTYPVSSVAQMCLVLCNPMDCSTPGFPAHHQLPEPAQTHVHRVHDAMQPSHPLSLPSPPVFNIFQHQDLLQ